jgi:prepilin-type N-terminal cleavage/methylation domain-containing protein
MNQQGIRSNRQNNSNNKRQRFSLFPPHYPLLSSKRGFTLIELLVVIAIIGLLSSVVLASLNTARAKARDARRLSDLQEVQKALELYYDKHLSYPPATDYNRLSCGSGGANDFATALAPLVSDKFIPSIPKDPINTKTGSPRFCYEYISDTSAVEHNAWTCNGVVLTNYQYALLFSSEKTDFTTPVAFDDGSPYEYCIVGDKK